MDADDPSIIYENGAPESVGTIITAQAVSGLNSMGKNRWKHISTSVEKDVLMESNCRDNGQQKQRYIQNCR